MESQKDDEFLKVLIDDFLKFDKGKRQNFLKNLIMIPDSLKNSEIESFLDGMFMDDNDNGDKMTTDLLKLVSSLEKDLRSTFVECLTKQLNDEDTAFVLKVMNSFQTEDVELESNEEKTHLYVTEEEGEKQEQLNIKEDHVQADSEYYLNNFVYENAFVSVRLKKKINTKEEFEKSINTKNNDKQKGDMKDKINITNDNEHNMHIKIEKIVDLREDMCDDSKYFQNNATGENYFENDVLLIKVQSSVPSDLDPKILMKREYEQKSERNNDEQNIINTSGDFESAGETKSNYEHKKYIKTEKNNEQNVKRSNDEQMVHIKKKRRNEQQTNTNGDYEYSKKSYKRQMISSNEYIFKCEMCNVGAKTKELLQQHQESVHRANDNVCYICGEQFLFKYQLKSHRLSHTEDIPLEENRFLCDKCNKKFKTPEYLKAHIKLSHSGIYEFQCDKCSKCFNVKISLIRHQFVHKESKDFICDQCAKSFRSPISLESHIKTHGEKTYTCNQCGKGFFQLGNFKTHERVHNGDKPYDCDVCKKAFVQKVNLKSHQEKCSKNQIYEKQFDFVRGIN